MGKRFEGEEPTYREMLEAFRLLGLTELFGNDGAATAYAARYPMTEALEFGVIPGAYTAREIEELRAWAA